MHRGKYPQVATYIAMYIYSYAHLANFIIFIATYVYGAVIIHASR